MDFKWCGKAEQDIENILARLREIDAPQRRGLGRVLGQIHALANGSGTAVLVAAASDKSLCIREPFSKLKNAYERAFWCFLNHRSLFDSVRVHAFTYSLPKSSSETRIVDVQGDFEALTETHANGLVAEIKRLYGDEDRAKNCRLDHHVADGILVVHAYPSDYVDEVDSYLPDGELTSVSIQPPFHIFFYLDKNAGTLSLLAKGGADKHDGLFNGFARSVLHCEPPIKFQQQTYDLSLFKSPNLNLAIDPADNLRPPRVVQMKVEFPESHHHRALFEVNRRDARDNIYALIEAKLQDGLSELSRAKIIAVELQAVFTPPGQPVEEIIFRISTPRWCTLGHEGRDAVLRRYLRSWKVETDGKRVAGLSKAASVR